MKTPICFNLCQAPVVTTICGVPVCQVCANHYLRAEEPRPESGDGRAYARTAEGAA